MADYLLDTQYLIWFQDDSSHIPTSVLEKITNINNRIYFSQISLFEIVIKQQIGKLPGFSATIEDVYNEAIKEQFTFLPITNNHIQNYRSIPLFPEHRDPFDRLLIATAHAEQLTLITSDKHFYLYQSLVSIL